MIQSLLQYEAFDQNIFDPSKALQLASSNSTSDLSNLTILYESRTNYLKVIEDLKLNIDIRELSDDESLDINISTEKDRLIPNQNLKFSFSDTEYALVDNDLNEIQSAKYGEKIQFNGLLISINSSNLRENRAIDVRFYSPESRYNILKSQLDVSVNKSRNSFFRNEGLLTVTYISDDVELGKDIINYANAIFLNQRIYDETEKSRKAINFIENNIQSIEERVEVNKNKLKVFREKNKSIDVTLEIEAIVRKIQSLDESLDNIDIELARAEEIYTTNNPAYLNLLNKKVLIERQKEEVLNEIEMMPKEQQEYIDLFNNLEVSQALYEELESRRLGFSILEASTIGDIRVIDEAYVVSVVSPKITSVAIFTFLAFIIACIIASIRGFYYLPISNPAEIFDNNINLPIIGVIPHTENIEFSQDDIRLNTSIESLIVNINSIQNNELDKNIITITSPSPFNGKSTISMKLAEGYAKIGKRVLLVDNDLKRGKIARTYNVKSISEKTFNGINESTIENYKIQDNFYLIPELRA